VNYGRSIPVIAEELFKSTIREKRFYLAVFYYNVIPLLIMFFTVTQPVVQSGTGIAVFYAHLNTANVIKSVFISFFLGQILLVLMTADHISGEVEMDTFPLLRSKPVYDSEIILGKYLGMLGVMFVLDLPTIIGVFFMNMLRYNADYPEAYFGVLDEVLGVIVILLLLQGMLIALTLIFSVIFSKSLYAILSSLLLIFILSSISGSLGESNNYVSFNWLLDAILPNVFYNLNPINSSIPSGYSLLFTMVGVNLAFLTTATLILRNKELP
jgi:ABC-2 type transport system permease protein